MNNTLFAIWYVKRHSVDHWLDNINQVQAWIIIELTYFGAWCTAGIVFLFISSTFSSKRFLNSEYDFDGAGGDIWRLRGTEDYLKHLKAEFYDRCYMLAFIITEVYMGFVDFFRLDKFGARQRSEAVAITIIAMTPRIIDAITWFVYVFLGLDGKSPRLR